MNAKTAADKNGSLGAGSEKQTRHQATGSVSLATKGLREGSAQGWGGGAGEVGGGMWCPCVSAEYTVQGQGKRKRKCSSEEGPEDGEDRVHRLVEPQSGDQVSALPAQSKHGCTVTLDTHLSAKNFCDTDLARDRGAGGVGSGGVGQSTMQRAEQTGSGCCSLTAGRFGA